jgi:glyoxylase-like metal-dependent hydrolase (beta-lactamase superfamily II)/rhodanese-related sulfurtransferase
VLFRQFIHDDLGCASYLVGDEGAGVAAVVDPRLDVEDYLATARYVGVEIRHVLETHNHADHVSGHGRLADATGATIHVHRLADAEYDHEPFDDGWTLELGDVRITAVHAPGHRPEHSVFVLFDADRGGAPWAVLTGDSLFVNDVARPDLAVEPEDGARAMFRTLHGKLLTLPAETEVWPAHLGGSMCGGPDMDLKTSSTIGYERAHNALLAETDEDRFVERALAELGPQPPNFGDIVARNRGPLPDPRVDRAPLVGLTPRQVRERVDDGALVVDIRTDRQFADAHIAGAVSISALHAGFGTRLAWIAGNTEREIVLVGRDDDDAHHAAGLAAAIGMRDFGGHLAGGMTSWRDEGREVQRLRRIDVDELHRLREQDGSVQILDVREASEWRTGHIPGAVHTPYHDVRGIPEGIDATAPVAVMCVSGQRAAVAASLLQRFGAAEVLHVVHGGVPAWARAGYPME